MNFKKYFRVWFLSSQLSTQSSLENRASAAMFLIGKIFRFVTFFLFINLIFQKVPQVFGYRLKDIIIFFLMFNLLDIIGQLFFRGIYWFREQVITGEFDFSLTKPISALFLTLTRQTDILDVPLLLIVIYALINQPINLNSLQWLIVFIMFIVAFTILMAIHVLVASIGILTTEVDHTMMIFRDISGMARLPVDIYTPLIKITLTYIIPIAIAFTFPAKALLGIFSLKSTVACLLGSVLFLFFSLKFWQYSLNHYSSASS